MYITRLFTKHMYVYNDEQAKLTSKYQYIRNPKPAEQLTAEASKQKRLQLSPEPIYYDYNWVC